MKVLYRKVQKSTLEEGNLQEGSLQGGTLQEGALQEGNLQEGTFLYYNVGGEERGVYRVLLGKPEGRRPLGRPRRRWVGNIRIDLQEVGCGYMH